MGGGEGSLLLVMSLPNLNTFIGGIGGGSGVGGFCRGGLGDRILFRSSITVDAGINPSLGV